VTLPENFLHYFHSGYVHFHYMATFCQFIKVKVQPVILI